MHYKPGGSFHGGGGANSRRDVTRGHAPPKKRLDRGVLHEQLHLNRV